MGESREINKLQECVACGNKDKNRVFTAEEKMFGMGHRFEYLECSSCRSLQLIHIPKDPDIYYPNNYYAFGGLVKSHFLKNILKMIRWRFASRGLISSDHPHYFSWLKELNANITDRIADIGCGNGQLLYEMKCSGFKDLHGFDPYLSGEVKEKGFELLRKGYDEIDQLFDIVMMHHSFEHMEFPKKVFASLQKMVKKGGQLLIRLPVTDGDAWKIHGINWFQLDAPRHFFIPSIAAMEVMAITSGFKLRKVVFDGGGNQFWAPIIYQKGLSLPETNLEEYFSQAELDRFEKEAEKLNKSRKGDQACLYFERV